MSQIKPFPLYTDGTSVYFTVDGINFNVLGGGGGGTIHTSAPLSGDGSVGTPATIAAGAVPLTALAAEAANTLVGNGTGGSASPTALSKSAALSLLGIQTGNWQSQMFAFAKALYPTIANDFMVDFLKGTNGDYVVGAQLVNGALTISSGQNSGALLLSTGGGSNGGQVAVTGIGGPAIATKSKTGAPWFYAARAELGGTCVITATTLIEFGPTSAPTPYTSNTPFIGVQGSVSLTNLVVSAVTTPGTVTTTPIPALGTMVDWGIGFDGVTVTFFFGDLLLGTFASIATSTTIGSMTDTAVGPAAIVQAGATTSLVTVVADKLYMAVGPS